MISLETRVKFVIIGWAFFMAVWVILVVCQKADIDDFSHYIVETAMGLGSAALLMFDIKRTDTNDRKTDTPKPPEIPKTQEQLINDLIATSKKET